jgi:SAM-dependent methyltransferase
MNIQDLFNLGMKRQLPELLSFLPGVVVNLGCGKHVLPDCINLDFPDWEAERYEIQLPREVVYPNDPRCQSEEALGNVLYRKQLVRCPDGFLAGVHAYHFLEHVHDPRRMLREIQRCLRIDGVLNICVPHYWGSMAHHDLDHKHNFAIDTWSNTFSAPWYDKDRHDWQFRIHFNALMAITERNAAILCQLVKEPPKVALGNIIG